MLADLSVIPIGDGPHTSATLAQVLKAIDRSGIAYQLTPTTTCLEGSRDQIVSVARECHQIARRDHQHVITELRIEDHGLEGSTLRRSVDSVERKAGRSFNKEAAAAVAK